MKQKKFWEPFRSCLLNSTANPANFHPNAQWKLAGLAVLFSRWQLLNGFKDFFVLIFSFSFRYFLKYKTIETHAPVFLPLNISAVGSVKDVDYASQEIRTLTEVIFWLNLGIFLLARYFAENLSKRKLWKIFIFFQKYVG